MLVPREGPRYSEVPHRATGRRSTVGGASVHDDLSHDSVRFGQPAFAFTYSSAVLSISGRTLSLIGWIERTVVFHFVPSPR